jgi:hypothetical protein
LGKRVRQPEPVSLPVRQLIRRPQQEPSLRQPTRREQLHPLLDRSAERIDERHVRQLQIHRIHGPDAPADLAQERRLPTPTRPGEQDEVALPDVELDAVGDGVLGQFLAEAEQVGDLPGRKGASNGPKGVADGEVHGCFLDREMTNDQ